MTIRLQCKSVSRNRQALCRLLPEPGDCGANGIVEQRGMIAERPDIPAVIENEGLLL
jgi:hypothetical protein